MDKSNVLSFISRQEYTSPKSVYDRLYLDFSKRNIENKLTGSSNLVKNKTSSTIRLSHKIEDVLLQKQVASKSKLKVLKARYQAEEIKEIKQVPEINEVSRILAAKANDKSREMKSAYINSILSTSRFTKMVKNQSNKFIKTATIKLDDCEINTDYNKSLHSSKFSSVEERNRFIDRLKSSEESKQLNSQKVEKKDMLKMDVVDRGKY